MKFHYLLFVFICLIMSVTLTTCGERVRIGAEVLVAERLDLLAGKRVGIICNHTSILADGVHVADTLVHRGVKVTALFGPEHGIRGTSAAGELSENGKDTRTGLPVYSLYGKTRKPTAEMLANVDVLVFDIQDVGARFYTYASTMAYAMQAAAENGKRFIVLDRPNPINGTDVEGTVLDTAYKSFVGLFPIPNRHGLTLGELARMIAGEGWLGGGPKVDLEVIKIQGWNRNMWYDETSLPWIAPSPNMKTLKTATVYPGMCLFEGVNISEGRGTEKPFEYIGSPWMNGDTIAHITDSLKIPGVRFERFDFTPVADSVAAPSPKFKNELCHGVFVHVLDRTKFHPVAAAVTLLNVISKTYGDKLQFRAQAFDQLAGVYEVRNMLSSKSLQDDALSQTLNSPQIKHFLEIRKKYLLY
ncbi:MAG TPA: DUF1343 domain-containing protein [Bacteroidota bacterium]|nr:DUF1343 domain-containing protein [Bacteroidota bacterium]